MLTDRQTNFLSVKATKYGCTVSEVLRRTLDEVIDVDEYDYGLEKFRKLAEDKTAPVEDRLAAAEEFFNRIYHSPLYGGEYGHTAP
jgi:predicted ATPase with chaperone activity